MVELFVDVLHAVAWRYDLHHQVRRAVKEFVRRDEDFLQPGLAHKRDVRREQDVVREAKTGAGVIDLAEPVTMDIGAHQNHDVHAHTAVAGNDWAHKQFPFEQFVFPAIVRQRHKLLVGPMTFRAEVHHGSFHNGVRLYQRKEDATRKTAGFDFANCFL